MFCEDRDAVRKMTESMKRNYESIREERETRRKMEEGEKGKINSEEEDEDEHTLSECD